LKLDTFALEDKSAPRGAGLSEQEVAILIIWKLDTFALEDKAAPRGAGLSEQEVAILIIGNLTHIHLRTQEKKA